MKTTTTERNIIATLIDNNRINTLVVYDATPFFELNGNALAIALGRGKTLKKEEDGIEYTATTYDGLCYVNNAKLTNGKTIRFNYTDHEKKADIETALVKHYEETQKKTFAVVYSPKSTKASEKTGGQRGKLFDTAEEMLAEDTALVFVCADLIQLREDRAVRETYAEDKKLDRVLNAYEQKVADLEKALKDARKTLEDKKTYFAEVLAMSDADFSKKCQAVLKKQNAYTLEKCPALNTNKAKALRLEETQEKCNALATANEKMFKLLVAQVGEEKALEMLAEMQD